MGYVLGIGLLLLMGLAAYQWVGGMRPQARGRVLRWGLGGVAVGVAIGLALLRRFDLAFFAAVGAFSIIAKGRIGPYQLGGGKVNEGNISKVQSRYLAMELDHDTGEVSGRVLSGQFGGWDLMDLGEAETRALIEEIRHDPDSLALLESWLDANRAGWREYFEEAAASQGTTGAAADPEAEAYEVLGLAPGASADEVRSAHRELMKKVHPDHGGSSFLASKINEARDFLLERLKGSQS